MQYKDLAHAVEDLKKKGITNLFSGDPDETLAFYITKAEKIKIVSQHRFEMGTDPGDEATLYTLDIPDEGQFYLVISYGAQTNPIKSKLLSEILKYQK